MMTWLKTGIITLLLTINVAFAGISHPQLLQLVDYIGADYAAAIDAQGQVISETEYAEMQEFSTLIEQAVAELPATAADPALLQQAQALQTAIKQKASVSTIQAQSHRLSAALQSVLKVRTTPLHAPNFSESATIFAENCSNCHGETGHGDGPMAAQLDPAPTDFHDKARMQERDLFALYNTITLGIQGTAMVGYEDNLSEDQRWSLAAYIKQFSHTPATPAAPPLQITQDWLKVSVDAYAAGDTELAYEAALSAYLEGFEMAEATIDLVDPQQRLTLETSLAAFRNSIENQVPLAEVQAQFTQLSIALQALETTLPEQSFSPWAIFSSAHLILLREGLESLLIVGMLIMLLIKAERRDLIPSVHAGWILAVVAGLGTFWISDTLLAISGATRELTEGLTALLAAGILLYVGIWMHRHQIAKNWRQFLQHKLDKHLQKEARFGLGFLAFLAVYREAFETILFYQALLLQAGPAGLQPVIWGIVSALALLLVIIIMTIRFGLKLPLQAFFTFTRGMIFLFAFVFVGQGIHGLLEAGKIPLWPVPIIPTIPWFGIYPQALSLVLQAGIVLIALWPNPGKRAPR